MCAQTQLYILCYYSVSHYDMMLNCFCRFSVWYGNFNSRSAGHMWQHVRCRLQISGGNVVLLQHAVWLMIIAHCHNQFYSEPCIYRKYYRLLDALQWTVFRSSNDVPLVYHGIVSRIETIYLSLLRHTLAYITWHLLHRTLPCFILMRFTLNTLLFMI